MQKTWLFHWAERRERLYCHQKPWEEECRNRILRHRKCGRKKRFETVECYRSLKIWFLNQTFRYSSGMHVNLVSNELFGLWEEGDLQVLDKKTAAAEINEGILHLERQTDHLVIVTNEVFSDGDQYSPETNEYRKVLETSITCSKQGSYGGGSSGRDPHKNQRRN